MEMNRSLYESGDSNPNTGSIVDESQITELNLILKGIIKDG